MLCCYHQFCNFSLYFLTMDVFAVRFVSAFEDVDELIFCLFLFSLPFGWTFSIIMLALLLVSQGIVFFRQGMSFDKANAQWSIPLWAVLFVNIISVFFSDNSSHGWSIVSGQLSFLLIPLVLGFKSRSIEKIQQGINWFVFGNVLVGIIAVVRAFVRSIRLEGDRLSLYFSFDTSQANMLDSDVGGNYFWGDSFAPFLHPSYWGVMILVSFAYLFYRFFQGHWPNMRVLVISAMLFLLGLIICNGTNGVILSFFLMSIACVVFWWRSGNLLQKKIMVFPIVLAALVITLSNPQSRELVRLIKKSEINSIERRIDLFNTSSSLIANTPFGGYGIGDTRHLLCVEYKEGSQPDFAAAQLNTHNQFIDSYLKTGIPGLVALLAVFVVVFFRAYKTRNFLLLCWGLVMIGIMMSENTLLRYDGILFFTVSFMLIKDLRYDNRELVSVNR